MSQIIERIVRSEYPPKDKGVIWLDTTNNILKSLTPNGWTKILDNNKIDALKNAGYLYAGIATLDTNPKTPDVNVFYIANEKGTYKNFDGINVTENEVVILYYDNAWHKISTGIASDEKLSELSGKVDKKQDTLTLTIKDNGNIVLANIQGQSKEFMPATPSGDPMHYAYEAIGAVWNDTGADIVNTAPWAELADDDADKVVIHKAGHWYLNGLGDLTNKDMRLVYFTPVFNGSVSNGAYYASKAKTVVCDSSTATVFLKIGISVILRNSKFETFGNNLANILHVNDNLLFAFSFTPIFAILFTIELGSSKISFDYSPFDNAKYLKYIKLKGLNNSVKISASSLLSCKSILYMIQNEAVTSAITITLHADAYARAMANADIVAALEAHPNVSLASA